MERIKSGKLYQEACRYIPGGVNSPVRAFKSVGLDPIFIQEARGSRIVDVDGQEYIDYIGSWGPMILGHGSKVATKDVARFIEEGTSFGFATEAEVEMAKLITEAYPSIEKVRMVNSGTEATMSALRVARGYTGRDKILKFEGCYHGHSDALLVRSGSGTLTFGVATSAGVPADVVKHTLVSGYNDSEGLRKVFSEHENEIAAVIVEPIAGNMGVVAPDLGFLKDLRRLTKEQGTVLIFDEVITGFRVAYGGAQEYFDIEPDMTCLGKIIGAGLPVGAFGGKREIMDFLAPLGPVYQAGTLSGNPLAMKMGMNVLSHLRDHPGIYREIEEKAEFLEAGFKENIEKTGAKAKVVRCAGMLCLFFCDQEIKTYQDVMACDTEMYARYFKGMLDRGILLAPAQYEGIFLSAAHTYEDLKKTIEINGLVLEEMNNG
jgi:glutamate-1-semialdehyde 2,1-aminomutase